jgi:hypothetical protein
MEYRRPGTSGQRVSRIALACMSFGDTSRGFNECALGDAAAEPIFRQALDLGITLRDAANVYTCNRTSEKVEDPGSEDGVCGPGVADSGTEASVAVTPPTPAPACSSRKAGGYIDIRHRLCFAPCSLNHRATLPERSDPCRRCH